ncbi:MULTISPECIES: hypothetical protein [Oceanibaculum]|uniref:Serine protease n=1 Tax=Oceanibaculum indicum TaxID=526216 RepID=A0A420WBY1_9PROT|nr:MULTISPECIES: hypothetical protein [Oceanibaculum]MCH2393456.1 hypothetical protein [Oceanibaculum sp.]RKQ68473.1 V8-like Glu-specific endopeptidase [Oceanibaculum indicum]
MYSLVADSTVFPYRAMVYIEVGYADTTTKTRGSGVVIGTNDVLTASHVLNSATFGPATSVTIIPGMNAAGNPFDTFAGVNFTSNGVITEAVEISRDVAVIGLSTNIAAITGSLAVNAAPLDRFVTMTGYPGQEGRVMTEQTAFAIFRDSLLSMDDITEVNGFETLGGHSGAPYWYQESGIYQVGAIHFGSVGTSKVASSIALNYDDIIFWGLQNDSLLGGVAHHRYGTALDDRMVAETSGALLFGGGGNDTLIGGEGQATLIGGTGNDSVQGSASHDYIDLLGGGDNVANGQRGGDTLIGGAGDDVLRGGKGFDSLVGGAGDDTLYAGLGQDTLTGGNGADLFVLRGYDPNFPGALLNPTVTDFVRGTDVIGLEGIGQAQVESALALQDSVSGGVAFQVGGATVTVLGVTALDIGDFVFTGF